MDRRIKSSPFLYVNESAESRLSQITELGRKGVDSLAEIAAARNHVLNVDPELLLIDLAIRDKENEAKCNALREIPLKGIGLRWGGKDRWLIGWEYLKKVEGQEIVIRPVEAAIENVRAGLTRMAIAAFCITH